jgi:Zn-dependent peptidase ImmA (M78 family)/DNA-binding XRE family transcriptional regulator
MVALARESRGLTQGELAKQLADLKSKPVTQGTISKIEQGLLNVSEDVMSGLVGILKYPETFFYQTEEIYAPGMSLHRKRVALPSKTLGKIEANTNILRFQVKSLLKSVEDLERKYPYYDIDEYGDPETIALMVRQAWLVPRGPVDNLTRLIERAGIIIIECDFETRLIDGLTVNLDNLPPIIFVNKDIPGDRYRFTLAHELGHIIMHKFPSQDMEKEADRFASEFLMPTDDIGNNLTNISLPKLADLKLYWKVSMASLLVKANTLDKLTPWQNQYLWRQFAKLGYKTREPAEINIPRETPTLLRKLVDVHLNDLQYTVSEIARILHIEEDDLFDFYLEKPKGLRSLSVVK